MNELMSSYESVVLGAFRWLRLSGRDDELSRCEEVAVAENLLEIEGTMGSSLRSNHLRGKCNACRAHEYIEIST